VSASTPALLAVGAKLLGVFLAYRGLQYLGTAVLLGGGPLSAVLIHILYAVLAFAFSFVLVFRTRWLGRLPGSGAEASDPLDPRAVLGSGIILIGLYVLITRAATVLHTVQMAVGGVHFGGIGGPLARVLIECVPLALAVLFVLRSDWIAELVTRDRAGIG